MIGRTAEEVRDWWVGQNRPIREGRGQWCGGCPVVFWRHFTKKMRTTGLSRGDVTVSSSEVSESGLKRKKFGGV